MRGIRFREHAPSPLWPTIEEDDTTAWMEASPQPWAPLLSRPRKASRARVEIHDHGRRAQGALGDHTERDMLSAQTQCVVRETPGPQESPQQEHSPSGDEAHPCLVAPTNQRRADVWQEGAAKTCETACRNRQLWAPFHRPERVVHSRPGQVLQEGVQEGPSRCRMSPIGSVRLFVGAHARLGCRLLSVPCTPPGNSTHGTNRRRLRGQRLRFPRKRPTDPGPGWKAVHQAEGEPYPQGRRFACMEDDDYRGQVSAEGVQETVLSPLDRRGRQLDTQAQVGRFPQEPRVLHPEERAGAEDHPSQCPGAAQEGAAGSTSEGFFNESSHASVVSSSHWEKHALVYWAMESTILDLYELNPYLTDQEVVKALKSLRRMFLGEDTVRNCTLLPWTLSNVVRIAAVEKKCSDRVVANCIDRLIQSVENHSWGRNPKTTSTSSPCSLGPYGRRGLLDAAAE